MRHRHGVAGDGGEVGEQGAEAVDGQAVGGALGCGLALGGVGALGLGDDGGSGGLRGGLVVIVEQDGLERLAHVPFEIVGEHAQEHVGAHAVGTAMMDRPDLEIDGLDASKGAFDLGEIFVGPDGRGGVERLGLEVGAQHIDAIERGFGVDLRGLALEGEIVVGDGEDEVLGHFVTIDHGTDRERDLVLAAQRLFGAPDAGLNGSRFFSVASSNVSPLAGALVGEHRIAADHQALTRIIG